MNPTNPDNTAKNFFSLLPRKYIGFAWGILFLIGGAIKYLTAESNNSSIILISHIPMCISFGFGALIPYAVTTDSNELPLKRALWVIGIISAITFAIIAVLVRIQQQH